MIRQHLRTILKSAVESLVSAGTWPEAALQIPISVDLPKAGGHGDVATNFAMVGAKVLGLMPVKIAEALVAALSPININGSTVFEKVEIAGPGFINMSLTTHYVGARLGDILAQGERIGYGEAGSGPKINVEFVSVNPNGPITIGSGRGAAYGSTLCNVLEASGATIHREYYINDGVNSEQMRQFAESVRALAMGREVPEKGYKGDYVLAVAETIQKMFHEGFGRQIAYAKQGLSKGPDPVLTRHLDADLRIQSHIDRDGPEAAIDTCDLMDLKLLCETLMSDKQSEDLKAFGVTFDTWFSEQSLHDIGKVAECNQALESNHVADREPHRAVLKMAKGGVIEEVTLEDQTTKLEAADDEHDDSAQGETVTPTLWLRSTKFGDDMDRVLQRKDGRLTYITSDVAYHKDKFNRPPNADKLITVLGPDHHGYIHRLRAVLAAMFIAEGQVATPEPGPELSEIEVKLYKSAQERDLCLAATKLASEKLQVQIFQIVRFLKEGKPAPMRKRDGNIFALIDLIDEIGQSAAPNATMEEKQRIGRDVARFFYLMRNHDTAMDFDLDLAVKQSDDNPVYYVQYAHARICSVLDKAREAGLSGTNARLDLLTHAKERTLILRIAELEEDIRESAKDYAVNRLTTFAVELARTFHAFYDSCRVVQAESPELSEARVQLCLASKNALVSCFSILGISAPVRMERELVTAAETSD